KGEVHMNRKRRANGVGLGTMGLVKRLFLGAVIAAVSHSASNHPVQAQPTLPPSGPAQSAPVQGASNTPKSYLNKGNINLPIMINAADRPHIQEVQLYVKEGPQGQWVQRDRVPSTQSAFNYRTTQDGEYWFSVVTVDRAGKSIPADVTQQPPGIIVVID